MSSMKLVSHLLLLNVLLLLGTFTFVPIVMIARAAGWRYEGGDLLAIALLVVGVPAYLLTLNLWRQDNLDDRFLKVVASLWVLLGLLAIAASLWPPAPFYFIIGVWVFVISTKVRRDPLGLRTQAKKK
jgi:hypothetical protein